MAGGNMALAFGSLVAGAIVIDYGVKNSRAAFNSGGSVTAAPAGTGSATPKQVGKFPASVDPLPGAVGSRLDQGLDFTAHTILSPFAGTVEKATASDPGWNGGGYIAIKSTADPSTVYYVAEGLVPTVTAGETVTAGQRIAMPAINPYNGIIGNGEAGLANPADPGQPLAQVVSDKSGMVDEFYHWILSLGGPTATSTSGAGYA